MNNGKCMQKPIWESLLVHRPRKDAELPGLEKVENLIWAQLAWT